jgi:thiamine biosynthesis lipoprotein
MMGMPITIEVVEPASDPKLHARAGSAIEAAFAYFNDIDHRFSTYKPESEIMQINRGELALADASPDMQLVFALSEQTRLETDGFFDIQRNGFIDPSGLVKGWAIQGAAEILHGWGFTNYYVEAGGDIQPAGHNAQGDPWRVGIRNPFNDREIIKVVQVETEGVATSGTYVRGNHIYNPKFKGPLETDIVSLTVIGPNIYEADRFATAAFAMGRAGIAFIDRLPGFEGYMIDKNGQAQYTSGFDSYVYREAPTADGIGGRSA